MKYKNLFSIKLRLLLLIFSALFLSSCNQDFPCIEADDFGFPKVTIYAKGSNVTGEEENQLSDWVSSGYKYNGDEIVIMAFNPTYSNGGVLPLKYTWNPWLCQQEDNICVSMYDAPKCNLPLGYCSNSKDREETIDNAPCYLSQGEAVYLLITDPMNEDITNPNTYDTINRMPDQAGFYTKSLWDEMSPPMYHNGEQAHGYNGELTPSEINYETGEVTESNRSKDSYIGGEAYFKILDRYYEDNSGYQYLSMKRGFDSVVPPPIASIISFVTETMNDTSEELYKRIIVDYEYRLSLKILLVLYIIVHGVLFIGGASDMTQKEFISMFIKLIIVIQLIAGESSWQLFNDYFFKFFTSGLDEMIGIVTANFDDSNNGFTFFDTLLNLLFSWETSMKIQALIWSFPSGFVAAFIIYAAFALFTIAIAKAVMIYLLAYMAISLLIIVAPVFICFMFFQSTRPLFEGWVSQFLVFFMQAVMVMAALNLLAQIIVDQIYMTLGFRACYEDWLVAGITSSKIVISKAWLIASDVNLKDIIDIPGYGYHNTFTGSMVSENGTVYQCDADAGYACPDTTKYCEPYECSDERYVDLPFLDPDIEREADLIENFKTPSSLSIPILFEATILLLMCYLMMKFNDVVPGLAKGIASGGGSAGSTAIGSAANSVTADFKSALSGMKNLAGKIATGKSEEERGIARRKLINAGINSVKDGVSGALNATKNAASAGLRSAQGLSSRVYNNSGYLKPFLYPVKAASQAAGLVASGSVVATKFLYKATSFYIKDVVFAPGSLMIGSPKELKGYKDAVKKAKEENRIADWNEGKRYDKSYGDKIGDYFKEKTGMAEIERRAEEFDRTYYDYKTGQKGEFLFKNAAKGIGRRVGQIAYNTDIGKAIVDEYNARFTEQGRIDRINASKIDNRIHVLATQYQQENPLRDKRDRVAAAEIDQYSKALNLDKNVFLSLDADGQRKYADRAYLALAPHQRNAGIDQTYNELKNHLGTKGAIIRSARDIDPSVLTTEASDALGIDKTRLDKLSGKEQLVFLEKGLRSADLNGAVGADAYRAYRYLKERAQAKLENEKYSIPIVKVESKKPALGMIWEDKKIFTVKLPDFLGAGEMNFYAPVFKGTRVAYREGDGTEQEKILLGHSIAYDKDPNNRIKVDNDNSVQVLKDASFVLGVNEATIQSIAPEKRLAYVEAAINKNPYDFESYKGYRAIKEIIEKDLVRDSLVIEAERQEQAKIQRALERESKIHSYEAQYQRGKDIDVYQEKYAKESLSEELMVNKVGKELGLAEKDLLLLGMLDKKDQLEGLTNQSAKLLGLNEAEFAAASKDDQSKMLNNALSNQAIDLSQEKTYSAYKMLKRSIGDDPAKQELKTEDQKTEQKATDIGISKSVLDLVDKKGVRSEMILEKAGEVGISESELQKFNSLDSNAKLEMLNNTLKNEAIDLSKPDAYAAYQALRDSAGEMADYGPKPATNPFDDNYQDPSIKSKSAELFGKDEVDFAAKKKEKALFEQEEIKLKPSPKSDEDIEKRDKELFGDGNKGPLEESKSTIFDEKEKNFKFTPSKKTLFGDDEPL